MFYILDIQILELYNGLLLDLNVIADLFDLGLSLEMDLTLDPIELLK